MKDFSIGFSIGLCLVALFGWWWILFGGRRR